ncbi:MAG: long-chain fatty acid--CoA ligase [Candidatus Omnitrophota bacterium]
MRSDHFPNIPAILQTATRSHPERTAIIFGQNNFTYRNVYEKAQDCSLKLQAFNIQKKDRIALLLDNSPEFVFAYFGILMAGAIVVPVNHLFKRDEIKYILEDSGSIGLVTSPIYKEVAEELNVMVESLQHILYTKSGNAPTGAVPQNRKHVQHPKREDMAVFLYTSGTTGHPKAAMLTHGNLLANIASSSQAIDVTKRDAIVCFLPLFHSFAATVCMLMPLANGARMVILKSPRPIKKIVRTIQKNKVTIFVGIPSIYNILKDTRWSKFLPGFLLRIFNPVRLAISGAAALPAEIFKAFERKYRLPLLEGYGLTEASPVVSLNPLRGQRKAGSIGLPIPGVRVKIIDESGEELKTEQVGELCVHGPNVMQGYYKRDEENAVALKDHWLRTGDMAKMDHQGYIFIMGRKKEMINVRGLNVYPREIEEVLYQHPHIKEAAVVGLPDPHKGEVPKGFVVLKNPGSLSEHEVVVYLRERLALYKVPRQIEMRTALPKNTSGKILKRILVEESLNVLARRD